MAARKTRKKKNSWGGKRPGAGRPVGSGSGPSPDARVNRVAVMLSNDELANLKRHAKKAKLPVSTMLYEMAKARVARKP